MAFDSSMIPADVVRNVRRRWPQRADAWSSTVGEELRALCARYDATPRRVLPARYGFVVAVETARGGLVMRASPDPNGPHQTRVAIALADLGVAPTVHDSITTDTGTWTVLNEIRPGTPLADTEWTPSTVETLAAVLRAMHGQPAPGYGMPSIIDWLWDRLHQDSGPLDAAPGTTPFPPHSRHEALAVLDELASDTTPQLCHGDLSPWNILLDSDSAWKLVDPRGMTGETAYDVAVLGLKAAHPEPATALISRLAEDIGLDARRVRAWASVAAPARV